MAKSKATKEQERQERIDRMCERLADILAGVGVRVPDYDTSLTESLVSLEDIGTWIEAIQLRFFVRNDQISDGYLAKPHCLKFFETIREAAEHVVSAQDAGYPKDYTHNV